jgi:hypothetical protein
VIAEDARAVGTGAVDAGAVDAGTGGTGAVDATAVDAGTVDAGTVGTGAVDAGAVDAGTVGTGAVDATAVDAGTVDAGTVGTGAVDAAAVGAGTVGTGAVDAGAVGAERDTAHGWEIGWERSRDEEMPAWNDEGKSAVTHMPVRDAKTRSTATPASCSYACQQDSVRNLMTCDLATLRQITILPRTRKGTRDG